MEYSALGNGVIYFEQLIMDERSFIIVIIS